MPFPSPGCKSHHHNSPPGLACSHPGAEGARGGLSGGQPVGVRAGPTELPLGFSCSLLGRQEASHLLCQPQSQGVPAEPPFLPWGELIRQVAAGCPSLGPAPSHGGKAAWCR